MYGKVDEYVNELKSLIQSRRLSVMYDGLMV